MTTLELKSNFHKLIDSFGNEGILTKFYEIMSNAKVMKEQTLWSKLSNEEQEELIDIIAESKEETNLIDNSKMKAKHSKWL